MEFHVCVQGKDRAKLKEKVRCLLASQARTQHKHVPGAIADAVDGLIDSMAHCPESLHIDICASVDAEPHHVVARITHAHGCE